MYLIYPAEKDEGHKSMGCFSVQYILHIFMTARKDILARISIKASNEYCFFCSQKINFVQTRVMVVTTVVRLVERCINFHKLNFLFVIFCNR